MVGNQSKKYRRPLGFAKPSSSMSNRPSNTPLEPSQTPPTGDSAPSTGIPDNTSRGALARIKCIFRRPRQIHPSSIAVDTAHTIAGQGAQEQQEQAQESQEQVQPLPAQDTQISTDEPELDPVPASVANDVNAAVKAFDDMDPVPLISARAIDIVGRANTSFNDIQNFSDMYLKPFIVFNEVVKTLTKVHPYAQVALGLLAAASNRLIKQANLDHAVYDLLDTVRGVYAFLTEDDNIKNIQNMRETLGKIAQAVNEVALFIKNYTETKSFWRRLGKNVMSETQDTVDGYTKVLNHLMQQYRDRAVRDVQINVYRVLEDLNLDGMAYAGGASLNRRKQCLDGTRTEILEEIISWIHDTNENTPRILWLYGQAGRGKSAIAHTVALWFKNVGELGSCFCFARERQAEHREEKIFTTIARDLADRDPAFRRALAEVIAKDHSLKTTCDVTLQWEKLVLGPLSQVSRDMIGKTVVVVDALDECGLEELRSDILSVLASAQTADLPHNIRILVTSRPLPDIQRVFSAALHVKVTSLDNVPMAVVERDVGLYVSKALEGLRDIGVAEVRIIAQKSDGLFEWARLACEFIKPKRAGRTVRECFSEVILLRSGGGSLLLDGMYKTILESVIPNDCITLARFRSMMQQILSMLDPLPFDALNVIRYHLPDGEDHYDVSVILDFMGPLLGGVVDKSSPVRPLHASFYDFLTDSARSGVYFVGAPDPYGLASATLEVLGDGLEFNICRLESSYVSNAEVPDLQERISKSILPHLSYACRFWAQHLLKSTFQLTLARMVKALVGSERVLFWLEIMSLLDAVGSAADALALVVTWLVGQESCTNMLALVEDGIMLIHNFGSAISHSTPHLYISALPFIPSNTVLSAILLPKFSSLAEVSVGGLNDWPAAQVVLKGHTDGIEPDGFSPEGVKSVAFSPDGKRIVSTSWDRTVRLWDTRRGTLVGSPLKGHTSAVESVAFSHDSKRIVSGAGDKTVRVWDAERGEQIGNPLKGHTDGVQSVSFSPDGKRIVSGSRDKTVRVWDSEKGEQIGSPLQGHTGHIQSVAFSPDGKWIVSGSWDETVRVWDAERGMQIGCPLEGHTDTVNSVVFSPDGKRIVSGSQDSTLRVWDAERHVQIGRPLEGHAQGVESVALSPDGKRIVSGSWDRTIRVWDAERGVQIGQPLEGHTAGIYSTAYSLDGKRIVSSSFDNTLRVWDAMRCVLMTNPPEGHTGGIFSVAISPDGKMIVSGSLDNTVRIWDAGTGMQIGVPLEGHTSAVESVAFSPIEKRIVSGSRDMSMRVWDIEKGVQIGSPLMGHTAEVQSVAFSPDGKKIVSGSWDKTVRIWDIERGIQIGSAFEGHKEGVKAVVFSPDSMRVVSGSLDCTIRVWDAEQGIQIDGPLEGHASGIESVAFSPDGKRVVSGSWDRTVRVWEMDRHTQIGSPLKGHKDGVQTVAFSLDGKKVVSGSWDKTVRVWDVERGVQVGNPLEGHTVGVFSVAFFPDGKRIVSGSWDKTLRIWDLEKVSHAGNRKASVSDDTHIIPDGCHVCFSPISSHALYDIEHLLNGFNKEDVSIGSEPVRLQHDGWIRGPNGRLLLWIPAVLREPFYSMWTTAVMPRGCCVELDLSQMVHGSKWHRCFLKTAS